MFDKTKNKSTGNEGEGIATQFLVERGYKILERNLRLFCGEIDVLAEKDKKIIIVEVKTVRGTGFGLAQDLVRYKKQEKLRTLAKALEQQYPKRTIQVDVIGVDYSDRENPIIEHIENAVN